MHRIITKWNNFQLFLPTFSTKMSKNELQPIRTNLSRNIIVRKAPLIFCFLFIFVLKTMRNCSKPPSLTVAVQSRSPSRTHRLDVVVHYGGNLDLNFFKSSILSQPLALDPHHLVVPASLCSRIVMMMMMMVVMMMMTTVTTRNRRIWCEHADCHPCLQLPCPWRQNGRSQYLRLL